MQTLQLAEAESYDEKLAIDMIYRYSPPLSSSNGLELSAVSHHGILMRNAFDLEIDDAVHSKVIHVAE